MTMSEITVDHQREPASMTEMPGWPSLLESVRAIAGAGYKSKSEWLEALDLLKQVKAQMDLTPASTPADLLAKREALVEMKAFHERLANARRETMSEIGFVTREKEERVSALEALARTTDGNAGDLKRAIALRAEFFAIPTIASERHDFLPRVLAAFAAIKERREAFREAERRARQERVAVKRVAGRPPDDEATVAAKRELVERIEQLAAAVDSHDALKRHRQAAALRKAFHAIGGHGPAQREFVDRIAVAVEIIKERRWSRETRQPDGPEIVAARDAITREVELLAQDPLASTDDSIFQRALAARDRFHDLGGRGGPERREMAQRINMAINAIKRARRREREQSGLGDDPIAAKILAQRQEDTEVLTAKEEIVRQIELLADPRQRELKTDRELYAEAVALRKSFHALGSRGGELHRSMVARIAVVIDPIKARLQHEVERVSALIEARREAIEAGDQPVSPAESPTVGSANTPPAGLLSSVRGVFDRVLRLGGRGRPL